MTLSITLDGISFTMKETTDEAETWLSLYASDKESVQAKPVQNYTAAYRTRDDVLCCWHSTRTEMGYHYVFGGTALRNIWECYGVQQKDFIAQVVHIGGRISLLDLAKDSQGVEIDLNKIYKKANDGDYIGTARTTEQRLSKNGGNTVYIGSRQSEKFIRIYNKSAETGQLSQELWIRFEIETKGMVARALAKTLASTENWSGAFDYIARSMFNPKKCKDYDALFEQGVLPIGLPKLERTSDREKWISEQVTPAIVKHYLSNKDSEAIKNLRTTLDWLDTQEKNS